MASINDANIQLAWLMEQHPGLQVIIVTEQDVDAGYPQIIRECDVVDGIRHNGWWYWSPDEITNAYHYADLPEEIGDDVDWYFDRHADRVIRVILCDEEDDD